MISEFDFQVLKLTNKFYEAYPNPPYVEIEAKEARRIGIKTGCKQTGNF